MQQKPMRVEREQPVEVTAEVQGSYPNLKQNLAKREICNLKSQPKPAAV